MEDTKQKIISPSVILMIIISIVIATTLAIFAIEGTLFAQREENISFEIIGYRQYGKEKSVFCTIKNTGKNVTIIISMEVIIDNEIVATTSQNFTKILACDELYQIDFEDVEWVPGKAFTILIITNKDNRFSKSFTPHDFGTSPSTPLQPKVKLKTT